MSEKKEVINLDQRREEKSEAEKQKVRVKQVAKTRELRKRYIQAEALVANNLAFDLGLDGRFIGIFAKHMLDLNICDTINTDDHQSRLFVCRDSEAPDHAYHIEAIINPKQVEMYSSVLGKVLLNQDYCPSTYANPETITPLALDWVIHELSADALGNSCYMQQRFDCYIPDYNGQNIYDNAELTISNEFLRNYADVNFSEEEARADHNNFRAGYALELLRADILRRGLTDSTQRADWITHGLAKQYPLFNGQTPITPLRREALMVRCANMQPVMARASMAQLALSFYEEDDL